MTFDAIGVAGYAKLGSALLAIAGAGMAIRFTYKVARQWDDPARKEKERLSRLGWLAIIIVVAAGLLNAFADIRVKLDKVAADKAAIARQDTFNRRVDSLLQDLTRAVSRVEHSVSSNAPASVPHPSQRTGAPVTRVPKP